MVTVSRWGLARGGCLQTAAARCCGMCLFPERAPFAPSGWGAEREVCCRAMIYARGSIPRIPIHLQNETHCTSVPCSTADTHALLLTTFASLLLPPAYVCEHLHSSKIVDMYMAVHERVAILVDGMAMFHVAAKNGGSQRRDDFTSER